MGSLTNPATDPQTYPTTAEVGSSVPRLSLYRSPALIPMLDLFQFGHKFIVRSNPFFYQQGLTPG